MDEAGDQEGQVVVEDVCARSHDAVEEDEEEPSSSSEEPSSSFSGSSGVAGVVGTSVLP